MQRIVPVILIAALLAGAATSLRAADTLQVSVFISDISYAPLISYNSATAVLTFKDTALTRKLSKYKIYCFTKQFSSVQPYLNQFYCGMVFDSSFLDELKGFTNVHGDTVFFPKYEFRAIPFCRPPIPSLVKDARKEFRVFPNPSEGDCYVVGPAGTGRCQWTLSDVRGQVLASSVHEFDRDLSLVLPLSNYPSGIYFLRMEYKDGMRAVHRLWKR